MRLSKETYFLFVLLLFHAIGIFIFLFNKENVQLTYVNIGLTGILVFLSSSNFSREFILFGIIFIGGYIIEWVGVNHHVLFGDYHYGETLGLKLLGVPIVIGMNWYIAVSVSSQFILEWKWNIIFKSLIAGLLATGIDFLIEPIAIKYDFWQWNDDLIPTFNYICWFIFASLFSFIYFKLTKLKNKTAFYLFFIWVLFFGILNLLT